MASKAISAERRRAACWLALALVASSPALAEDYPARPVRIISQAGIGSAPDVMARIVADQLGKALGQQAIIINRPGASGANAAQMAAGAEPDGYTLFMANSSTFTIMPETQNKLSFDVGRDFVPVGFVAEQPMLIAVTAGLPVTTLADLIALAKERPGQLLYAANAGGSTPNITGEFFRERAGIDITYVSYPGAAAGLTDVVAGRVQIIVEGLPALLGAVEGRSIRPLRCWRRRACRIFPTSRLRAIRCRASWRPAGPRCWRAPERRRNRAQDISRYDRGPRRTGRAGALRAARSLCQTDVARGSRCLHSNAANTVAADRAQGVGQGPLAHVPEKWMPVFRKGHAQT